MEKIAPEKWNSLLAPYLDEPLGAALLQKLEIYLDLLLRWNAKMNLTAIRDPETIIKRHFGESLFVSCHLQNVPRGTLLDHGSGAGFPGLPIGLARPDAEVTLSESQQKKSTFLREVVRATGAANIGVHSGRTETLSGRFEVVTMRAVDDPGVAYPIAAARVTQGGILATLESAEPVAALAELGFVEARVWALPDSETVLRFHRR